MTRQDVLDRISVDPNICFGKPCTRVRSQVRRVRHAELAANLTVSSKQSAVFSSCGRYRYRLTRDVGPGPGQLQSAAPPDPPRRARH